MDRAALRYAKAILNLAKDNKQSDKLYADMQGVANAVSENKELQQFLNSPTLKAEERLTTITKIFKDSKSSITKGLFQLLVSNKRLNLLPNVAKQYVILFDKQKGVEVAKVTTAIPLTDELKTQVKNKIKEALDIDVTIENEVDESIIGGIIILIGDKQFDSSISGKFSKLKRKFNDASYEVKI